MIFEENGHFMDILASPSQNVYFHAREVKCHHIKRLDSTFASLSVLADILNFSIFYVFEQKLHFKCINDAYFRSQEVKTYQISYLTEK